MLKIQLKHKKQINYAINKFGQIEKMMIFENETFELAESLGK